MALGPRVLSLVPSATDWVVALGMGDRLVGVTHECEVPPGVSADVVVRPAVSGDPADPAGVDAAVAAAARDQRPLYEVDVDAVVGAAPTVVLTQTLCDVCAVAGSTVDRLAAALPGLEVVTLDGVTLDGVLADAERVGAALGATEAARRLTDSLRGRLRTVADAVADRRRVAVAVAEWPDPLFLPGHWVPDQVSAAGGVCVGGASGQPSRRGEWGDLADAEAVVVAPCGYGLADAATHGAPRVPEWLDAEVWAADAHRAFSRPSAGVVDGVEALAAIAHPDAVGELDPAVVRRVRTADAGGRLTGRGGRRAD
jgi:iron complex transport system substrate-binding protein